MDKLRKFCDQGRGLSGNYLLPITRDLTVAGLIGVQALLALFLPSWFSI